MSNYVHNYVFCSCNANKELLSKESLIELFGRYDEKFIELSSEEYLVIFDTRGMEYRTEYINKFIEKYKDTRWLCVEENEIAEGCYYWNGSGVVFEERSLVCELGSREIRIQYTIESYTPLLTIFLSDKEIVIERILQNECRKYPINGKQKKKLIDYYEMIILTSVPKHPGYIPYKLSRNRELIRDVDIHWDGWNISFHSYTEDDDWKDELHSADNLFNRLIRYVKSIIDFSESISNPVLEEIVFSRLIDIHK